LCGKALALRHENRKISFRKKDIITHKLRQYSADMTLCLLATWSPRMQSSSHSDNSNIYKKDLHNCKRFVAIW
jgi:hypothetical protein